MQSDARRARALSAAVEPAPALTLRTVHKRSDSVPARQPDYASFEAYMRSRGVARHYEPTEQAAYIEYRWMKYETALRSLVREYEELVQLQENEHHRLKYVPMTTETHVEPGEVEHGAPPEAYARAYYVPQDDESVTADSSPVVVTSVYNDPVDHAVSLISFMEFQVQDLVDDTGARCFPLIPEDPIDTNYVPPGYSTSHDAVPYSDIWTAADDLKLLVLAFANYSEQGAFSVFNLHLQEAYDHSFTVPKFAMTEFTARYRCFANYIDHKLDRGFLDMYTGLLERLLEAALAKLPDITKSAVAAGFYVPRWWFIKMRRITDVDRARSFYYPDEDYFDNLLQRDPNLEDMYRINNPKAEYDPNRAVALAQKLLAHNVRATSAPASCKRSPTGSVASGGSDVVMSEAGRSYNSDTDVKYALPVAAVAAAAAAAEVAKLPTPDPTPSPPHNEPVVSRPSAHPAAAATSEAATTTVDMTAGTGRAASAAAEDDDATGAGDERKGRATKRTQRPKARMAPGVNATRSSQRIARQDKPDGSRSRSRGRGRVAK
ncbi:hypothetical protein POJ06DRAFT_276293 [Lipomyces tetrasporus]|uniref:Uncharacterized protein n=1 Tax=Lipomyces tetrasporus TaxID=54092 RepID=A0AAD7QR31_9ASCO|nr:uncharacterized protein POJ06DRAFT_276293 [Lipomyces tetrasporus]KAJ8099987.1 hypothetical protein POJ06DRAFT_276293 [Lipomyces tetrasporus]